MDTFIYFLLSIAFIFLFIIGIFLAKQNGWIDVSNVLLLVIVALLYDNGILVLGKFIGEGDLLKALNELRYWLHAFVTPLLVLFAWHTLVNANIKWASKKIVQFPTLFLTLFFIIYELLSLVPNLSLEPTWKNGVLSYTKNEEGIPVMIIGVSTTLLITSIFIWWKQRWPWYFVGILSMGIVPILNFLLQIDAPHNISEFLLIVALIATKAYQQKIALIHEKPHLS
ncbi:hypothetical protein ACH0B5_08845 [Ureibacillus sp. 179-F W5.1 NHS]|uniref:Phospholipid phosphatase n=1 Tax=Lysinibacillus halotolerans TaxID=1368476 RepID=A0A3M8H921_9BACI|nr:hypothetical protein [Lysinibacillus halotolerans]RNC98911.1 hypothetical protein EC501_09725 [Lysinibacillus halotolerans]